MRNFILLWLITIFRQEQNYIRIREHAKEIGLSDIKMRVCEIKSVNRHSMISDGAVSS